MLGTVNYDRIQAQSTIVHDYLVDDLDCALQVFKVNRVDRMRLLPQSWPVYIDVDYLYMLCR